MADRSNVIGAGGNLIPVVNEAHRLRLAAAAEESGLAPLCLTIRGTNTSVPVTRAEVIVGRHSKADIRLTLPDVSRRHCRLVFVEGKWHICDMDSLNGVYVNGVRVREAVLSHRDVLTIGGHVLEVDMRSHSPTILLPFARPTGPLAA
jgi:pSer/pThr/pTyr-binding forkhead associated (FHA) protein